jgi:hypothetical protein
VFGRLPGDNWLSPQGTPHDLGGTSTLQVTQHHQIWLHQFMQGNTWGKMPDFSHYCYRLMSEETAAVKKFQKER